MKQDIQNVMQGEGYQERGMRREERRERWRDETEGKGKWTYIYIYDTKF